MMPSIPASRIPAVLASTAILLSNLYGTEASAQSRWVFVNGQRLNDQQVARLDRMQCTAIPNGSYWLNPRTGAWGYMGNFQVQGILGDGCNDGGGSGRAVNPASTFGPFATMRRAEEEAYLHRQRGLNATAFHNGDGYYLRVWR